MTDIKKLLSMMTLEEKVLQLQQVTAGDILGFAVAEDTGVRGGEELSKEQLGAVGSALGFTSAAQAKKVRLAYLSKSRLKIPLLLMHDVIHGCETIFPVPLAIACSFDEELAEECAYISAREARSNGVDVTFSPMVDLVRDARWGRVMESSGEDWYVNSSMGRAFIRGYKRGGLACCVKHFAAYGCPEGGREYNTTDVSERNLKEFYLRAYRECLKEDPEMVMTSFNLLNGVPVNGRSDLLVDVLRREWGFGGVVISDFGAVREMISHGYCPDERQCALTAAKNGVDIEMASTCYAMNLAELVRSGLFPEEKLNESVERILKLKDRLGLFDNPCGFGDEDEAERICLSKEHRAVAARAAAECCVLLENNGVLPLEKDKQILLTGPFADEKRILGAWACAGDPEKAVSVAEGVYALTGILPAVFKGCEWEGDDISDIPSAVESAKSFQTAVVCIGEPYNISGESAARAHLDISSAQLSLLRALKDSGKRTVAVVFAGRPLVLTEVRALADAILYVWQPGTEGGTGIASVLFGETVPSAKLTMSFPRSVGQCPIYYNNFNTGRPNTTGKMYERYSSGYIDEYSTPLYPFGYGLSYTRFTYSGLRLSSGKMERGQSVTVSVTVTNLGKMTGKETVFLFIRDKFASVVRPVTELRGFKKIELAPGESKTVSFEITEEMLAFYTADGAFAAEEGEFEVSVGPNSAEREMLILDFGSQTV